MVGGAEIAIKELTDRMSDFEFDLITARIQKKLPSHEQLGRVKVYRVGWGSSLDKFLLPLLGLPLALKLHAQHRYALVWAMMASQASVLAVFFAKLKGVRLLTTLQEGDEEEHLQRYALGSGILFTLFIRPWHRLAIRHADAIQVLSSYLKERAKIAGATVPITVIPNGVSVEQFTHHSTEEAVALRKELSIGSNENVICTNSRLVYKNGVDILLKASALVLKERSIKLVIIGDGHLKAKLQELANRLGITDHVVFLGMVHNAHVARYLSVADVFVRPSRSEGQGIAFMEAMAAGVPIIAPPVGGIPDFLKDKETGLLCETESPESVAKQIKLLLSDELLYAQLSKNAKDLVEQTYNWNTLAQEMNQLFDTVS